MKESIYQNNLIGKKQLRQLLAWSFTNYTSMQACALADELKSLGFKYATQSGISISIEDLKIPFVKNVMLNKANQEILIAEKIYLKGKLTNVERFQKIIDTWNLTSESLKNQILYYFKNYDPLNSVYIMAFSGARGNLSQVRQLVGMRGLMSDPSGQIMNLPIEKNFREGLTITDYLMSGYGARKGIVDTALKTANSGYLTRRLIDVAQDILIREKDCLTQHSLLVSISKNESDQTDQKLIGRTLSKSIFSRNKMNLIAQKNIQITKNLLQQCRQNKINNCYVRSPLTCSLYRSICQKCYGWDLANENLVDIGEAVGILAGQSIGEPGTQLTMRTFHTGGIFTSEARQQIISPITGIIQFYQSLKTTNLRTNRGEDVLVTKNSGSIIIIPENERNQLIQIEILRNTILFPKNNHYILKDNVIGELINTNKQLKTEIKPIVANTCGEIFIPAVKQKINLLTNNKLIWILSGELYISPLNSFFNLYSDYKLNKYSSIFRTKIVNHYSGVVWFTNRNINLYQRIVKISNIKGFLNQAKLKKLESKTKPNTYLLLLGNFTYFLKISRKNTQNSLEISDNANFATLLSSKFQTFTGGKCYYNHDQINQTTSRILYYSRLCQKNNSFSTIRHRTIIWLEEEFHFVNCESSISLVEHGDFISKQFELFPNVFSKTSGIVSLNQKNNVIKTILIKSGFVYEGEKLKKKHKKIYFPGEMILSSIPVKNLSFCQQIINKNSEQLLVRPIQIYEFPYVNFEMALSRQSNNSLQLPFTSKSGYSYPTNQSIRTYENISLVSNVLNFNGTKLITKNSHLELSNSLKFDRVNFNVIEKLDLTNHIVPHLRYKSIKSCFLTQEKQFISNYTVLGYLEDYTFNSLEIVKFKIKNSQIKQIFLISNNNCLIIEKKEFPDKKLNEFVNSQVNLAKIGKIIGENDKSFIVQKGRPYFFPNCHIQNLNVQTDLEYKSLPSFRSPNNFCTSRSVFLNYYNINKVSVQKRLKLSQNSLFQSNIKSELSQLFIRKNGKLYSCLIPQFLKRFSITRNKRHLKTSNLLKSDNFKRKEFKKINRILLVQSLDIVQKQNHIQNFPNSGYQLTLLKFVENPFNKSKKSVGLYSITEDYFEQEVNSCFCKNGEFIDVGKTLGLLNLEKEITGDIVQGLPKIEEILEARRKNTIIKNIPTNQKKGLLIQKTFLDIDFEFKKLGESVKENDRINPHKLIYIYFSYYGLLKTFSCDKTRTFQHNRLITNYEGTYKSFKKVQLFILKSVQSVYNSQGVTINDKHLEVIIKQMTTKVLITDKGETPLLEREVIDLYHIQYINKLIDTEIKQIAYYIPLLLGITKSALNNPSFISAASFQETTRVLTQSAIEGKIDWLRGLKENLVVGHLIPAGTGSRTYRNTFRTYPTQLFH